MLALVGTAPVLGDPARHRLVIETELRRRERKEVVWLEADAQGGYAVQFGGHDGRLEAFDAVA